MYGPYNLQESLNWLRKYFISPIKNQPFFPTFPPLETKLNDFIPVFGITFVGDLMSLNNYQLELGPKLMHTITQNKYLVANLEAPLTTKKSFATLKQFNHPSLLELFKSIKSPSDTFFSVANNHSNDFGRGEFNNNLEILKQNGFNYFGTKEAPYTILNNSVALYGATEWSNTSKEGLSLYSNSLTPLNLDNVRKPINILYPHWGYEFEFFPRTQIIQQAHKLMKHWDAIIGHHSHCPQPITLLENSSNSLRPIVYSLGNFAINHKKRIFHYGIIANLAIGYINNKTEKNDSLVIGQFSWSFIYIQKTNNNTIIVELCNTCPFFE